MTAPTPCLGPCGTILRRSTGMAVCAACSRRVDALLRTLPLPEHYADPVLARSNIVWGSRAIVALLLAGEMVEAERAYAERVEQRRRPWRVAVGVV